MEIARRIAALLIALSLALPQRSCVNNGKVQIEYPLSNAQDWMAVAVIAAFFLLPLALPFVRRYRTAGLVAGVLVTAAGLYYVSYAATILATRMLVGWYVYTLGAIAYLGATLVLLVQVVRTGGSRPPDSPQANGYGFGATQTGSVISPRDTASGQSTGVTSPRDTSSGPPTGKTGN